MRVSYSPGYSIPLPEGHRFPMRKFSALFEILLAEGLLQPERVSDPRPAHRGDLERVHTAEYLDALEHGGLDRHAERRLGLPWSPALWRRSQLAVQGSIDAARMALTDGVAANLAGGTHHAFPDHGEGFCVLNDVAIAVRTLRAAGEIRRALIVDLDVHQGNGTAAIFEHDPLTYTFSMHGEKNFPFEKARSSHDIALPNGTDDAAYLAQLDEHLPRAFDAARPDLVCFLAGVDPVRGDRFGKLALSRRGLARRDRSVLEAAQQRGVPLALFLSGGYAETPELTADLHATVHREARRVYGA